MSTDQPVKLLLVDDHPIVRSGLRMLFLSEPTMTIVGEADSGGAAVEAVQRLEPDVVIMDVSMPGMNGIEATRRIKAVRPETAVLALTMYEDEQYFFEMLHAGASGYIPKRAAPDDLVSAIKVVAEGNVFLYSTLARFLIKDMADRSAGNDTRGEAGEGEELLTPREREVLTCIAEGMTTREIAEALVISAKTVERHRENIMGKLDMHNRVELVKYAIKKGLISEQ
jgi:DNA-binding NarL/FixJ family response regulator